MAPATAALVDEELERVRHRCALDKTAELALMYFGHVLLQGKAPRFVAKDGESFERALKELQELVKLIGAPLEFAVMFVCLEKLTARPNGAPR